MVDGKTTQQTKRLATLSGKVADKTEDLQKINQAHVYRSQFEKTIKSDKDVFKNKANSILLKDFIDECLKMYKGRTVNNFHSMTNHLFTYASIKTTLSQIDKKFCIGFHEYLINKNLKVGRNYFKMFKSIMNKAIDKELVSDMPYLRKLSIKYHNPKREYLTQAELSAIYHNPTPYEDIKAAFIFGCFTGLRYIDLANLKFTDIQEGRLIIKQEKTQEVISIMLNDTALEILEKQKLIQKNTDKVFNITSYSYWGVSIRRIIKQAGIEKKISGHCARHTFATLCITQGVDIFTTSKLLGHTDVKTTQIYAKLIDKKKDEAIMMLPKL